MNGFATHAAKIRERAAVDQLLLGESRDIIVCDSLGASVSILHRSDGRVRPARATSLLVAQMRVHLAALTPVDGWAVPQSVDEFIVANIHVLGVDGPRVSLHPLFGLLKPVSIVLLLCSLVCVIDLQISRLHLFWPTHRVLI